MATSDQQGRFAPDSFPLRVKQLTAEAKIILLSLPLGAAASSPATCWDAALSVQLPRLSTGHAEGGPMPYPAAAQFLRTAIPDIIRSYQSALRAVRSPLAIRKEAWPKCRDQAQAIVEDCVTALMGEQSAAPGEARRYSHLVGVDRAVQGIAVAESVRAVDILWSAMQPAVRSSVQCEAAARRTSALLLISTVFRSSSGSRLYAGAVGYGDAAPRVPDDTADEDAGRDASGETPAQSGACAALSRREREVLERVARAMTNSQIARELGIETATVKRHLNNIHAKLQADSRIDAINKAYGRR